MNGQGFNHTVREVQDVVSSSRQIVSQVDEYASAVASSSASPWAVSVLAECSITINTDFRFFLVSEPGFCDHYKHLVCGVEKVLEKRDLGGDCPRHQSPYVDDAEEA